MSNIYKGHRTDAMVKTNQNKYAFNVDLLIFYKLYNNGGEAVIPNKFNLDILKLKFWNQTFLFGCATSMFPCRN